MRRSRNGGLILALAVMLVALVIPATASAALPTPATSKPSWLPGTWAGTGPALWRESVIATNTNTASAWKYVDGAYQSSALAVGTRVWTYPWTAEWHWVWVNNTYYAVKVGISARFAACKTPATATNLTVKTNYTPAYKLQTAKSTVVQYLPAAVKVKLLCTNTYPNAFQIAGATPAPLGAFARVKLLNGPAINTNAWVKVSALS